MRPYHKILSALSLLALCAGCSSFYYTVDGYYESSDIPGWKYSNEKTSSMFLLDDNSHGIAYIVAGGNAEGTISWHGSFPLPEGATFQISELTATVRLGSSIQTMPIECTLSKPAVFDFPPYPKKDTYGFDRIEVKPGMSYDGHTMIDPEATVSKKVSGSVEMSGTVTTGQVESFRLMLPEIRISGKVLPIFDAQFRWNGKPVRIMKRLQ